MTAPKTIAQQFDAVLARQPDAPFLRVGDAWLTTAQVSAAADAAAAGLIEAGAVVGDRVVIALANGPMFRVLEHGMYAAGLIRVALTPRLHDREIAAIAADCTASVVCCDPNRVEELTRVLRDAGVRAPVLGVDAAAAVTFAAAPAAGRVGRAPAPDDVAMLHYSSGTTGTPKGATVTHAAWVAQSRLALAQLPPIGDGDVVLAVAPMPHFGGSMSLNAAATGAATVTLGAFSPRETLEAVIDHGVTVLPLAPIMLAMLADEDAALVARAARVLRAIPYGGSPLDPARLLLAARRFPGLLCQYYGLSETLAPVTSLTAADHDGAVTAADAGDTASAHRALASAGRVAGATEVRLGADAAGTAEDPGEVQVRSELVTAGYWAHPDLTARAIDADGWFHTADLGWFDDGDRLQLAGRKADLIVTGGFNVQPSEVERVIRLLPIVRDVAAVGVPDPRWGERVHASIVVAHDVALEHLSELVEATCRDHLAAYKRPLSIEILDALPRTALDKIDRKAIRRRISSV